MFVPRKKKTKPSLDSDSSTTFSTTSSTFINNDTLSKVLDPSDHVLMDNYNILHYIFKYTWKANFSAPVHEALLSGINVLDIGCGPGTWILDMATTYSKSTFYGLDISPTFPSQIKPVNAEFILADALEGLPFEDNFFGLIYLRFLNKSFTKDDWRTKLLDELMRVTNPGGWIEMMESGLVLLNPAPNLEKVWNAGRVLLEENGVWVDMAYELENLLKSHPQSLNVTFQEVWHAVGTWGGKDGEIWADHMIQSATLTSQSLLQYWGMSPEEFQKFVRELSEQLHSFDYNTSFSTIRVFCQKART
ncbi:9669_t:CDS:2 [Paraglomus occultum]|uniref:9669_t:CDS:1 n=1 Tax=Paraglomus occultum TaxID=144539 RepID=A0A9N9D4A9_9GLOM|nr:9669_t:CDS:2 [Paraglomus occultum]